MIVNYLKSGAFYETVIVILFGIIFIIASNAMDRRFLKSKNGNTKWYKSAKTVIDLINTIIIIILILTVLSINGVNVRKYVTSLGVLGIIASFALQDILKDVIMGLSIMFEGYYKVGDVIEIDGKVGKVVSFNIKTTRVFMLDTETTMSICNRNINQVGVCSDWVDITIPIGYDVDLHLSRNICRECCKKIERLRHVYSCDFLNTQELAESWVEYKLRIHCLPDKKPAVRRNAQAVVQDVFYDHGQEFPLSIKVIYNVEPNEKKELYHATVVEDENTVVYRSPHRRHDYELGRGAAKSKVCSFDGSDEAVMAAINEAERYATSENLDNGMKLRLRLLSEELLSLAKGLPNIKDSTFYIERDGVDYDICFEADAKINKRTREQLMEVSSTNTNEAYTGIGGMVSQAIDSMILMGERDRKGLNNVSMNTMEESIGKADNDYRWSYNIYKEKELISNTENGLSSGEDNVIKSVLTNLSDDIRLSVRTNHVSIRVLVKNEEDD